MTKMWIDKSTDLKCFIILTFNFYRSSVSGRAFKAYEQNVRNIFLNTTRVSGQKSSRDIAFVGLRFEDPKTSNCLENNITLLQRCPQNNARLLGTPLLSNCPYITIYCIQKMLN